MKKIFVSVIVFLVLYFPLITFCQIKSINSKIPILEIKLRDKILKEKDNIYLDLIFANQSDSTVILFDANPERCFDVIILSPKGKEVLLTEEGKRLKKPDIVMHRETLFIEPNKQQIWKEFNITNLFGELNAGKYKIKVSRYYYLKNQVDKSFDVLFDESKMSIVYSNEISFKVVK